MGRGRSAQAPALHSTPLELPAMQRDTVLELVTERKLPDLLHDRDRPWRLKIEPLLTYRLGRTNPRKLEKVLHRCVLILPALDRAFTKHYVTPNPIVSKFGLKRIDLFDPHDRRLVAFSQRSRRLELTELWFRLHRSHRPFAR